MPRHLWEKTLFPKNRKNHRRHINSESSSTSINRFVDSEVVVVLVRERVTKAHTMMLWRQGLLVGVVVLFRADDVSSFPVGQLSHLTRGAYPDRDVSFESTRRSTPMHSSASAFSSATSLSMWSRDDDIQGSDRIKACVPYILPLLDGDQFGTYIYERIPPLGFLDDLLLAPLVDIFHKIPFLGLGLFIMLTLGTRFNTEMDRNVRFSAQQAALIDLALIVPELIAGSFQEDPLPRYHYGALYELCLVRLHVRDYLQRLLQFARQKARSNTVH